MSKMPESAKSTKIAKKGSKIQTVPKVPKVPNRILHFLANTVTPKVLKVPKLAKTQNLWFVLTTPYCKLGAWTRLIC